MTLALQTPAAEPSGELAHAVGARIRQFRKTRDMTLLELAMMCKTTPQTIQRLETGNMSLSVDWIEQICRALNVAPYQLFADAAMVELQAEALRAKADLARLSDALKTFCGIVQAVHDEQLR